MSETGHAKNIEHFQQLIAFAGSWGAAYAPTNDAIKMLALHSKLNASETSMDDVLTRRTAFKVATNERETTFDGIRPLITRCFQYYESTGADQNKVDDVRTLKRKLDGARAKSKDTPPDADPPPGGGDPPTPPDDSISASQQSYTQLVEHLSGIIDLLTSDPLYVPGEDAIKTTTLSDRRDAMVTANTAVINANVPLSNALGARNDVMYADSTGIPDLAQMVKKYALAAFGNDSTQYNQIKGLEFVRPKK